MPRSRIAESYGNSIFIYFFFFFKGTSLPFSILAASIYISTNSVGEFPVLNILFSIYHL